MDSSPEYKAFSKLFADLADSVDASTVAPLAFSRDLLSRNERDAATNRMHTERDRMEVILKAVEKRILSNPQTFYTFVDLLEQELAFKSVVKKLNEALADMKTKEGEDRSRAPEENLRDRPPTKKELMKCLYHTVPDKWMDIGEYLEIEGAGLRAIKQQCLNEGQKCLMAMLDVWLARPNPPPTWDDIAEAVEFVGRGDVAKEIRDKYIRGRS